MNDPDHYQWDLLSLAIAAMILAAAVLVPLILVGNLCGWVPAEACR